MAFVNEEIPHRFLGGIRWAGGFMFWPMVRLSIRERALKLEYAVRLPGQRLRLELELEHVRVERIARVGRFPAPGVRLRCAGSPPVIFWTLRPRRVLRALAAKGSDAAFTGHIAPFWGTD